jgi:hypothetical protein
MYRERKRTVADAVAWLDRYRKFAVADARVEDG